nr:hypothetical protein [Candidatus Sigynarchaeota archaeon]
MKRKGLIGLSIAIIAVAGTFSWVILLSKLPFCPVDLEFGMADENFTSYFTNVTTSTHYKYHAIDDQGNGLDCLDIIEYSVGLYYGVHHHYNGSNFEVHLVNSTNLLDWTFVTVLAYRASMPDLYHDEMSGQFFLAHEQWNMTDGGSPCQISIKSYQNISALLASKPSRVFQAPSTLSNLEGTPNIHAIGSNGTVVQMTVHYNTQEDGLDHVAIASLAGFNTTGTPAWFANPWVSYNRNITCLGVEGHIGARYNGTLAGQSFLLQEVQLVRDDWSKWQQWFYNETSMQFTPLMINTHGGSVSFTNPHFAVVSMPGNPTSQCVFMTHFLPYQGAAPGEAGQCIYYLPFP